MFDETASSDDAVTRQRTSVLFDPESGRAVFGHTFVGEDDALSAPDGERARRRALLDEVGEDDARRLRFADATADLRGDGPAELEVVDEVVRLRPLKLTTRGFDPDRLRRRD
ncbi:hypothetical protein SAMN05428970_1645 [Agromyces sp. CF514]|uniref:hypothetical protein n=1 Tax=Agromyces sp. CF514 TaxID=1881031 RepID=UPI0008E9F367|nr:hypothetical protein [Agromyces sp. CF514]SFR74024.1 hypothetical protein SAMN05428970_1645 [Agromyces sp. CF514]